MRRESSVTVVQAVVAVGGKCSHAASVSVSSHVYIKSLSGAFTFSSLLRKSHMLS
jgi:hypothetical protein